jgi:hypothetical protein
MNPEIKAQWVAALRSGKYQQTRGALKRNAPEEGDGAPAGFCCLGVLCDLHSQATSEPWDIDVNRYGNVSRYLDSGGTLPAKVGKWAGLDSVNPQVKFNGSSQFISQVNDGKTYSIDAVKPQPFEVIAKLIEEQL